MRVVVVYDIPGWAYWRRASAIKKYAPQGWSIESLPLAEFWHYDYSQTDVLFNLEYTIAPEVNSRIRGKYPHLKIVTGHNCASDRKPGMWEQSLKCSDLIVANNMEVFVAHGREQRTCCISNGIDHEDFFIQTPWEERKDKAIWCGSTGKGKRYEEVLLPLKESLERKGIICDFRAINGDGWHSAERVNREVVWDNPRQREWYNSARYVVCASVSEGTPNYLLEAAFCGCIPVSTKTGNIMEFGVDGVNCVLTEPEEMCRSVLKARSYGKTMSDAVVESLSSWRWEQRAKCYYELFRRVKQNDVRSFDYNSLFNDDYAI